MSHQLWTQKAWNHTTPHQWEHAPRPLTWMFRQSQSPWGKNTYLYCYYTYLCIHRLLHHCCQSTDYTHHSANKNWYMCHHYIQSWKQDHSLLQKNNNETIVKSKAFWGVPWVGILKLLQHEVHIQKKGTAWLMCSEYHSIFMPEYSRSRCIYIYIYTQSTCT